MTNMTQQLDHPVAELHPTSPHALPFAPELEVRGFLLPRAQGNVLIYGATAEPEDVAAFEALGGVSRLYLNHRHEAMLTETWFDAPVFVHEADRASVAQRHPVRASFSRRHVLDDDLEVIPTPGHTPGATAYLWDSGRRRFLFTGDTVFLRDGEWVAAVLDSSDRAAYVETLELIRGLDFDVLVPWAASGPWFAETDRADTERRIGAILERVRSGDDG
jgi:glyoxylase-like metal-dependent hydrolase (beta-lactamase superfamily II)